MKWISNIGKKSSIQPAERAEGAEGAEGSGRKFSLRLKSLRKQAFNLVAPIVEDALLCSPPKYLKLEI